MCRGGSCGDRVRNRGVPEKKAGISRLAAGELRDSAGGIAARDTEVEIQEEGKEVNREGCDKASVASSSAVEGEVCERLSQISVFFLYVARRVELMQ